MPPSSEPARDQFFGTRVVEARRVAGLLQVHAEVDEVDDDLHVALRLHVAAHHAEAHERLAVLRHERRE